MARQPRFFVGGEAPHVIQRGAFWPSLCAGWKGTANQGWTDRKSSLTLRSPFKSSCPALAHSLTYRHMTSML